MTELFPREIVLGEAFAALVSSMDGYGVLLVLLVLAALGYYLWEWRRCPYCKRRTRNIYKENGRADDGYENVYCGRCDRVKFVKKVLLYWM